MNFRSVWIISCFLDVELPGIVKYPPKNQFRNLRCNPQKRPFWMRGCRKKKPLWGVAFWWPYRQPKVVNPKYPPPWQRPYPNTLQRSRIFGCHLFIYSAISEPSGFGNFSIRAVTTIVSDAHISYRWNIVFFYWGTNTKIVSAKAIFRSWN